MGYTVIWKLNVCVYGLNDTSRTWYFCVKEELELLNALLMNLHCFIGIMMIHFQGLITIHVDDLFWGGTEVFKKKVIVPFKHMFEISKENSKCFQYLGLQIQQFPECKTVDQIKYCKLLTPIEISKERTQKNHPLGKDELKKLRMLTGQMNWIATQTQPDLLFSCKLASSLKNATLNDMIKANKVMRNFCNEDIKVRTAKLEYGNFKFISYSDASHANLTDGGSQDGHVIFLTD